MTDADAARPARHARANTTTSTRPPRADNSDLAARIASYELAFKMQSHAPEAVDLDAGDRRHQATVRPRTTSRPQDFGRQCLLARRLVERGVRFVQLYSGGSHNDDNWDAHGDLVKNHNLHAGDTDKPIAGLLKDLKQRGLLDETLVVWGGEFGRQPTAEYAKGTGRDHNAYGFTMWMAGGGIKGGVSVGDDRRARQRRRRETASTSSTCTPPILHQLGLDPEPADVLLRRARSEARRRRGRASRSREIIA